ncbi:hypothetical protein N752_18195 [Desulforamulus aquiferis]|nr:hypothetical protein [Desulforamulus aquiferis]RYD03680.1 hypothetical protein N752_18195 [Desulforamulus aquiferis]
MRGSKAIYMVLSVLLLSSILFGLLVRLENAEANRIPQGVSVRGVDISNLEKYKAEEKLKDLEKQVLTQVLTLVYDDKSGNLPLKNWELPLTLIKHRAGYG